MKPMKVACCLWRELDFTLTMSLRFTTCSEWPRGNNPNSLPSFRVIQGGKRGISGANANIQSRWPSSIVSGPIQHHLPVGSHLLLRSSENRLFEKKRIGEP